MPSSDLYSRIKAAAIQSVKDANISGSETKVFGQIDIDTDQLNVAYPCVACVTAGMQEELLPGDNQLNDYLWPVALFILDNAVAAGKAHADEPKWTAWRKQITNLFFQRGRRSSDPLKNLPGAMLLVPEVYQVQVIPRVIFDPRLPQYEKVQSSLLLKVGAIESR